MQCMVVISSAVPKGGIDKSGDADINVMSLASQYHLFVSVCVFLAFLLFPSHEGPFVQGWGLHCLYWVSAIF